MATGVNLYDNVYGDFGSPAEAAVRQETDGEYIGQSSWMTAAEWRRFGDQLHVGPGSRVLQIGSGSGGLDVHPRDAWQRNRPELEALARSGRARHTPHSSRRPRRRW